MTRRAVRGLVALAAAPLLLTVGAPAALAATPPDFPEAPRDTPARATDPGASSHWTCPHWGMYGADPGRTFEARCASGLSRTSAPTLAPEWFFKTPKTVTASPAVVDGVVYVGDWSGTMYALGAEDGSVLWQAATEPAPGAPFGPIVSSAAVSDVRVRGETRRLVIVGSGPRLYAFDAADGSEVWVTNVGAGVEDEQTEIESSPVVHAGVVYVGMDVHNRPVEETGGVRGGLLAVDAATGEVLWKFNPERANEESGCSSVWSSPTLNLAEGLVYFATGNCPVDDYPWTPHTEAVTALDMRTGAPVWTFQPHEPNRQDWDFGATPNLFEDADGRRVLGIGNKDAAYYALDPRTGDLLWRTQVAAPGDVREDFAIGGFIGSTAAADGRVFGGTAIGGPPYFHALDGADGSIAWRGPQGPTYAASAVTNGVVLAGALDSVLHVYDAETGVVLNEIPLNGPVSSGPAVVGDQVFVGSGTSSSDACAKDAPGSEYCFAIFDETLGGLGGVHALRVLGPTPDEDEDDAGGPAGAGSQAGGPGPGGEGSPSGAPAGDAAPDDASAEAPDAAESTPSTGPGPTAVVGLILVTAVTVLRRRRRSPSQDREVV